MVVRLLELELWLLLLSYVLVALLAIVAYETTRALVLRWLRRGVERRVRKFSRQQRFDREAFKFAHKLVVKELLLSDPVVNEKILEYAAKHALPAAEVRRHVEEYADEIIPAFNLLTYYEVAYRLAKFFVHFVYEPSIDRRALEERTASIPDDAVVIYIVNHRSNVDFVYITYVLGGRAALSYAIGEWARVWPLEYLFKSFGGYFVRRGYREELYHRVLERYVHLISKHGVTQGIFPEGKLSRDGIMLPPKFGLLNYVTSVEADPDFARRLVFVPVGVNYDWVLEDDVLLREAQGIVQPKRWTQRIQVLVTGPVKLLAIVGTNLFRWVTRSVKHHGTASVSFGRPLDFREWLQTRGHDFAALDHEQRKPVVADFGRDLMEEVGRAIPLTHVSVVAHALLALGRDRPSLDELVAETARVHRRFVDAGAPIGYAAEYERFRAARERIRAAKEETERPVELLDTEREMLDRDEAEFVVRQALRILRRRKFVAWRRESVEVAARAWPHLRYYANAVGHHIGSLYPFDTHKAPGEDQPVVVVAAPTEEAIA